RGQLYTRTAKRTGSNGFTTFITPTHPDVPTGYWNAKVKVGGTEFTKTLKIETIKPNRLKINIGFDRDKLTVNDKSVFGNLAVTWLHGAPARNLKAKVSVTLTNAETTFPRYRDFKFTDPSRTFTSEEQTIFDGRIDEEGKARISAAFSVEKRSPGMLKANLITRVFEESGDFSTDFFSLPYSPYGSYVGIKTPSGDKRGMLLTDTLQWVDVVTVDDDGNPVSRTNLEINIYKIHWRYWWESSSDDLSSYVGNKYNNPVVTRKVSTANGKGRFSFRIDRPEWGRFLIRVLDPVSGHAAGKIVYIDWPGWAGRPLRDDPQAASMLTFNSDKTTYNVGEKAEIIIPTSKQGRALISLESGSVVIHAEWINASEKETRYVFDVTPEMAPNIYVHVTLVQPHGNTINDMPIRLYGVIPVMVENPETKLQPQISMPDVLEPEKSFTVKVNETNKKSMTYTLAIVDDGLLDLTRYKTPDPWRAFYAREALGIKTWDLYDQVVGAYGGRLESLLSIGGDAEEEGGQEGEKANRFKPVVIFKGPFNLQAGRSNNHVIEMPRYVGSVRTMVIAGADGAYGFQEKTTPVRSPLMVLATLPRVLGPGEEVQLPVSVFAMEQNIKNVKVQIKTNDLLIPKDEKTKQISFEKTGDKIVTFSLKTAPRIGMGKVSVIASSGNLSATYDIELDVRASNPEISTMYAGVIDPGKTWTNAFPMPGMAGTNTGVLEVSSIPPIDIERRLHYLIRYPHGCIEQITSAAFPQLYLSDVMELDEHYKARISNNIISGLNRLKSFLIPGGGFSYWPGGNYVSDWSSSYAGHFMLEAEKKGYALPAGMKSDWLKNQKKLARQWRRLSLKDPYHQNDLEQAYRLYTLALAGHPEMGAMNRLREEKDLSIQTKWRLAAAYALAGQAEIARQVTTGTTTDIKPYTGFYSSYGSMERDWAMILETLVLLNDRTNAVPLALKISESLTRDYWMSTQTTAYCLLSMAKFAGYSGTSKSMAYSYRYNDGKSIMAQTEKPLSNIILPIGKSATEGKIYIENKGQGLLYARIVLSGIPQTGLEKAAENNLTMRITYRDINGSSIDVSRLTQGTDFIAEVTVMNPSVLHYKDMALTHIFPSGWEIRNTRLYDIKSPQEISTPTYQDYRDDKVLTYFNLPRGKSKTFIVQLNAAYLGRFYLPGIFCEAMYDNSINAVREGQWVEVVLY
ncbi:MAG: alpha-2-macroglobulin, partial [Bacteroidales bacterium]|nr:alpha-2-macroglobulin [Bacteroidales bacterium]